MEVFHHFGIKISSESEAQEFSDIGIKIQRGPRHLYGNSIASFVMGEQDEMWMAARDIAQK